MRCHDRGIHVPNAHAIDCIIFSSTHRRQLAIPPSLSKVTTNHCRQPLPNPSSHPAFDCPVSRSSLRTLHDGTQNCHTTLIRSTVFFLVKHRGTSTRKSKRSSEHKHKHQHSPDHQHEHSPLLSHWPLLPLESPQGGPVTMPPDLKTISSWPTTCRFTHVWYLRHHRARLCMT